MSFNRWLVGVQGEQLHIQNPQSRLTGAQAVELAAWLVAMSAVLPGGGREAFERAYREVTST